MLVALTGAGGHLGAALCRQLLESGFRLRALVRNPHENLQKLPIEFVQGELGQPSSLDRLCTGAEMVYHLAGQISIGTASEQELWQTNVKGTAAVLAACQRAGVRRMVHFSSVHAFDAVPRKQIFDESAPAAHEFPYERSKAAAQALVLETNGQMGLETICLNPTAVLGPWDFKPSLQGRMVLDLMQGRLPMLTPGGFDWVDSRDIAQAALSAARLGRPGEVYLLPGRYATILELAQLIGQCAGRSVPSRTAPFWLLRSAVPVLGAWSRLTGHAPLFTRESLSHVEKGHPQVSGAKAVRDLNYSARPLEETVRDTCDWLTANYL